LKKEQAMPINYEALRTGDTSAQLPADGSHTAILQRAALVTTNNGERLVTEWSDTTNGAAWTSWNRFDETGLSYTIELLDHLGVDRAAVADAGDDDAFQAALDAVTGGAYDVRTTSQTGSRGDRVFVTTYVDARSQGVVQRLTDDIPVDTTDLPQQPAAATVAEDDIPF
jgi:hypothetical protein